VPEGGGGLQRLRSAVFVV